MNLISSPMRSLSSSRMCSLAISHRRSLCYAALMRRPVVAFSSTSRLSRRLHHTHANGGRELQRGKDACWAYSSNFTRDIERRTTHLPHSLPTPRLSPPKPAHLFGLGPSPRQLRRFHSQQQTNDGDLNFDSSRASRPPNSQSQPYPNFYQNRILEQYAAQETKRVTLRQLTVFGRHLTGEKLLKSANYARSELPVRLAHRIRDFQNLPFIVGTNPHIELLYHLYWEAFEKFRSVPFIQTFEDNRNFCNLLKGMLEKHLVVIPQLALGIAECAPHMPPKESDRFMNEMLRSRIGRRVLAEQHIALTALFEHEVAQFEGWIGIVNTKCNAGNTVQKCATLAGRLFREAYAIEPPKVLVDGAVDSTFTYIPDQVEYIIYELLKNAMRFTILTHAPGAIDEQEEHDDRLWEQLQRSRRGTIDPTWEPQQPPENLQRPKLPPIRVTIGEGDAELMFRISDNGGGIERSVLTNIWSYAHESKRRFQNFDKGMVQRLAAKVDERIPANLRLGLGLPMSKVYANYWGGSISLHTMHGYGTDSYVKIGVGNEIEQLHYVEDE
ncbi:hypothetical protein BJ742DRAFT_792737 [Cladochytrium replicatum]|nr:hypothetical protein BJ742DRAFT_792737 [Cladochytrium replicatum]